MSFMPLRVEQVSPIEAVKTIIFLIHHSEGESNEELLARSAAAGIERDLANRLLVLVPLAFSRKHYESVPMVKEYAEEYIVCDQGTERETAYDLASDLYFRAAANAASNEADKDLVLFVAKRSPEYDAINNVLIGLPEGAVPIRIGTSTPYVLCGEPRPRPWWRFWGR
jgi:hypothetical protein